MTDQFAALTPAAMREIISHLDDSIDILDRHLGKLAPAELQIKSMLRTLREQLAVELERHPGAGS